MAQLKIIRRNQPISTYDPSAVSRAGSEFIAAAGVMQEREARAARLQEANAKTEVALANAKLERAYSSAYANNTNKYMQDPSQSQTEFEQTLGTIDTDIANTLTSDRAKNLFMQSASIYKQEQLTKHDSWIETQTGINVFKNLEGAFEEYNDNAYELGRTGDSAGLANLINKSGDIVIAGASALSPENVNKLNERRMKEFGNSYILGGIQDRPEDIIAELDSGAYDAYVTPEEKVTYLNKAQVQLKKLDTIADNNLKARQEEAYETSFVKIVNKDEDAPTVDDITRMVTNGLLDVNEAETLIEQINKPIASNNDLGTYLDMNEKLINGGLSNRDISQALADGLITQATAEKYVEYNTTNVVNNPAVKRAMDKAKGQFPLTNQFGIRDPKAQTLLADLQQELIDVTLNPEDKRNPMDIVDKYILDKEATDAARYANAARQRISKDLKSMGGATAENIQKKEDELEEKIRNAYNDDYRKIAEDQLRQLLAIKQEEGLR